MIVNKPQFDDTKILKGNVYWLKKREYNKFVSLSAACLVKGVKPFSITVTYYDNKTMNFQDITINVQEMIDETFQLKPMVIKEEIE